MWPKECSTANSNEKKGQIFLQSKASPEITFNLEAITYYKWLKAKQTMDNCLLMSIGYSSRHHRIVTLQEN